MTDTLDRLQGALSTLGMKKPVRVATTAEITLSGLQSIDGVTVAEDDRVLVKDQSDLTENGPYVASSGAWSRPKDFDSPYDFVQGTLVPVAAGTVNVGTVWYVSSADIDSIGEDNISFAQLDFTSVAISDSIAAGSSINLNSTDAELVSISGSGATITAITLTDGRSKIVRFEGANTLANSASLALPGALNITTAAGDFALFCGYGSSVVRCAFYSRGNSHPLITGEGTIASAATVDLGSIRQQCITISGSTPVTFLGATAPTGTVKFCRLSGAVFLTNSASIVLPEGRSIQGASGDTFIARHDGSGVWYILNYTRAVPQVVVDTTATVNATTSESDLISYALPAGWLASSGAGVRIRAWGVGTTVSTAVTRRLRMYFGATMIADSGSINVPTFWEMMAHVVRSTAAGTQEAFGSAMASTGGAASGGGFRSAPAETLSNAVTIKVTGLCTASSAVLTQNALIVERLAI
jgi:hypothetical protein